MQRDWRRLVIDGEVDEEPDFGPDFHLTDEEVEEINRELQNEYEQRLLTGQEESCPE